MVYEVGLHAPRAYLPCVEYIGYTPFNATLLIIEVIRQ